MSKKKVTRFDARYITKPDDVRRVLAEQVRILRKAEDIDPVTRARAITYVSSVMLTAMRDGDLEQRITEIEKMVEETGGIVV